MKAAAQYINWIDGKTDHPPLIPDPSLAVAARKILQRMREARKVIVIQQNWDSFLAFHLAKEDFLGLLSLYGSLINQIPKEQRSMMAEKIRQINQSYSRFLKGTSYHPAMHVLRGFLRRRKDPLTEDQRALLNSEIDNAVAYRQVERVDPVEILAKKYYRRTKRWKDLCSIDPFRLPKDQVRLLPDELKSICAQYARQAGLSGHAVPPDRTIGFQVGSFLANANLRLQLDQYLKHHQENDDTIGAVLALRQKDAQKYGFQTFAHMSLEGTVTNKPRRIIGPLSQCIEIIAPVHKRFYKTVAQHLALPNDQASEMDARFVLRQCFGQSAPIGRAFPLLQTMDRMIKELMPIGGWEVGKAQSVALQSDGWLWPLRHPDGRTADLLVCVNVQSIDSGAGDQLCVRPTATPYGAQHGLSIINLYSDTRQRYLNLNDLGTLCHEIGHTLHALSPGSGLSIHDGVDAIGGDMLEFPSQLLELYCNDPKVLARWSNSDKNAKWSNTSFWKTILQERLVSLPDYLRHLMSSWYDLNVHSSRSQKITAGKRYAKGLERFRLPEGVAPETPYLNFLWDHYASLDFTYPLGMALASHFGYAESDDVNAKSIARVYQSFHDHVLSKAHHPKGFRKLMEEWTGQDFDTMLSGALKNYGKMIKQHHLHAIETIKSQKI